MSPKSRAGLALFAILSWSLPSAIAQGNTTCKGTTLDWYTSVVQETPCTTYQRLRQICNSAYQVPTLRTATPPDQCDDQLAECCCNSIAFSLSMLCLNCQQGVGSGVGGDTGFDAGSGAYQSYLSQAGGGQCAPVTNKSLSVDIQKAVCNQGIKLEDEFYSLFWDTGEWFYEFTRETISKDQLTLANNTFTHCPSTTINTNTTSSVSASHSTAAASSKASKGAQVSSSTHANSISPGAIAGIAIGGIVVLLLAALLAWYLRRRRQSKRTEGFFTSGERPMIDEPAYHAVEPFMSTGPAEPVLNSTGCPAPVSDSTMGAQTWTNPTSYASYEPSESGFSSQQPRPPIIGGSHPITQHSQVSIAAPSEKSTRPMVMGADNRSRSHSTTHSSFDASSPPMTERHMDAGPVPMLSRSESGRLPPAYGEQRD